MKVVIVSLTKAPAVRGDASSVRDSRFVISVGGVESFRNRARRRVASQ